jgi:hypothetical protein
MTEPRNAYGIDRPGGVTPHPASRSRRGSQNGATPATITAQA